MAETYKSAVDRLAARLDDDFERSVSMILQAPGHVIVSGMGKSGLIGRKIVSTLASTGTPSLFLHPAEAIHGDLGQVRRGDVVLLISNSGETEEIIRLLPALQRLETRCIAMTGAATSSLAKAAAATLDISVDREACPLNLAPTTSALTTLVMGDALAIALMEKRGFQAEDFAATHPGGALGKRLLTSVADRMVRENLPFVAADSILSDVIVTMTQGRLGIALVGAPDAMQGIITDGDLRRALVDGADIKTAKAATVMTTSALTIRPEARMTEAEEKMLEARVQCLVVVDDAGQVVGVVQIY